MTKISRTIITWLYKYQLPLYSSLAWWAHNLVVMAAPIEVIPLDKYHLQLWLRHFPSYIHAKQFCTFNLQRSLTVRDILGITKFNFCMSYYCCFTHTSYMLPLITNELWRYFSRISLSSSRLSLSEKVWSSSFLSLSSIALVFDNSSFTSFDGGG